MLRKEDLELAVKFNIIDKDLKNKILADNDCCVEENPTENNYISTIKELKETIIMLTNELRKKDEDLRCADNSLKLQYQSYKSLGRYLDEAKSDIRMLEKIIDNLSAKNKKEDS